MPVVVWSKVWNFFGLSTTDVLGSSSTRGMNAFYYVLLSHAGRGLAAGLSPIQGILQIIY
jgi:hypothetical protein